MRHRPTQNKGKSVPQKALHPKPGEDGFEQTGSDEEFMLSPVWLESGVVAIEERLNQDAEDLKTGLAQDSGWWPW